MACGAHGNGYKGAYPEFTNVTISLHPDGTVEVQIGIHDQGCGLSLIHIFTKCGYKGGHWLDVVWMEKFLQEHSDKPGAVIPVGELQL